MSEFKTHQNTPVSYLSDYVGVQFEKLHDKLGVEVTGLDLSRPLDNVCVAELRSALTRHGLLLLRDQRISMGDQERLTRYFGEPISHIVDDFNSEGNPAITILSNVQDENGKSIGADRSGLQWHTDGSFRATPPMLTILYGVECPPVGANTEFCSAIALFNSIPKVDQLLLADCEGVHDYSFYWMRYQSNRDPLDEATLKKTPPVRHPAVRTHPISGMNGTYFMKCMTPELIGPLSDKGAEFIERVEDLASIEANRYSHQWKSGDVLIWDNCSMLHRATDFDNSFRRVMHRSSIVGERPFFSGLVG